MLLVRKVVDECCNPEVVVVIKQRRRQIDVERRAKLTPLAG